MYMIIKRRLIITMCALIACVYANADVDPEEYHVSVILFSGDTINGYLRNDVKTRLKNMFSKSGSSIRQYINVGTVPKGGDTKRYSATEVREYRFIEPTEATPDGAVGVSERINSPAPFKPNASVRGFAWALDRRDNGAILRWNIWESTTGSNYTNSRLVPVIGVKFRGAKAAYPIITNGHSSLHLLLNYLKKIHPEFKQALEDYYWKGIDSKAHTKELIDNPTTILLFYDEFLLTHDPIADPDENEDL